MSTVALSLATPVAQSLLQPSSFVTSTYSTHSSSRPTPAVKHESGAQPASVFKRSTPSSSVKCRNVLPSPLGGILAWVDSIIDSTRADCITDSGALETSDKHRPRFGTSGGQNLSEGPDEDRLLRTIPQFVIEHAPLIHLYSKERFWPCDMAQHLQHVSAYVNYFPLATETERRNLTTLSGLNIYGLPMYLTSDDNVEDQPEWLQCTANIPVAPASKKKGPGRSGAPVPLIVVEKDEGIVDAFWFFFYSFNLGNQVLGRRYGNHVGDWEHAVVRFTHGEPTEVFFSEHTQGRAFTYKAVEKIGKRPVGYSASGSHALYATASKHPYILPWGLLYDVTDEGPLWDPLLNMHAFTYELSTETLRSSDRTPEAPTEWFYFNGRWGDRSYRMDDERQYRRFRNRHYVDGPLGPIFKDLNRTEICISDLGCTVRNSLAGEGKPRWWTGGILGDEESVHDGRAGLDLWYLKLAFPSSLVWCWAFMLRIASSVAIYFGHR